ncbi:hypothetical protein [Luteimonas sp. R10]|uniref:hypothetical protein n=1 Tax=Luteimonas sp. R10 TaxID=3108176 RepID=UPI003089FDFC|nr:hypothetical protein U3649_03175 [Luteimonas sp. R10]
MSGTDWPDVAPDGDALILRFVDCGFRGTCRARVERYVHVEAAGAFRGTAGWAPFAFDPDDDTWRRAPPLESAPVPEPDCDAAGAFPEG